MLPAVPLSVPPEFPDTAVSSAMCLWAEDVDLPVDIARQAVLYVHAKLASELSQHPSADCTCLSKPLQKLMVTAVRAVTGDASFHLLCDSDAQSDGPAAGPATDNTAADNPSTAATATTAAPRRTGRQHKPAAEYWKMPPAAPWGGSMSHPRPPLYSFCLSMSMVSERGRSGRHYLHSCKLGHGMALLCKRHTMLPSRGCPMV